jgi:lycopene beta-cyclase
VNSAKLDFRFTEFSEVEAASYCRSGEHGGVYRARVEWHRMARHRMAPEGYDVAFVGGGLAAALLLNELGPASLGRVAVVDPRPPSERPPVHLSYWSRDPTPYDRFAVGAWRQARVANGPPESIAPFTLRLVRSTDVLAGLAGAMRAPNVRHLRTTARSISRLSDGYYEVLTDDGAVRARWVFDSACGVEPVFPSPRRPRAVLSGTGLRVEADRPVFDAEVATLFDPLDEASFAYLLPLSPAEALVESASFGPAGVGEDRLQLLKYLWARHAIVEFSVTHAEYGAIPLGFAPPRTSGPRHVLIGAKRGLVKPSAGYGIVRIARESGRLGRAWSRRRGPRPSRRAPFPWGALDAGFVRLASEDPRLPVALLGRVMRAVPLARSLGFIDERISPGQLVPLLRSAAPVFTRKG